MTLRKSILLFIGLGIIAALVACSSSSHHAPTIAITANSGYTASAQVGASFGTLSATVTSNGSPAANVSVTFTAPGSGASGTFTTSGTATETDTTNSSGVATSSAFTANTTAGAYTVTATTSGASTPASFGLTNTAGAPADLAAPNSTLSANTGATYASLVAQVTDSDGNGVSGVAIQFTINPGGTGASGSFTGGNTETVNTDTNGNATVSDLTANGTAGAFTVTAAPTTVTLTPASVTFNLTNTTPASTLSNGNYTFFLSGINVSDTSFFFVAGTFTVASGAITGGEQDYVDINNLSNNEAGGQDLINPTGSSIKATADGNLQIVLNVCSGSTCTSSDTVVGVSGVETINAALRPTNPNRAVLSEFDASGSANGELRQQDPVAAAATPSLGYAFTVSGWDNGALSGFTTFYPMNLGGIINVDGAGTISGAGSIFDANDDSSGTTFQGETLQAGTGTVSAPDAFGRVVFSITPTDTTDFSQISWVGYIADSGHVYLVETADAYVGTTGGIAYSQGANTSTFSNSSVSTLTYGSVLTGFDANGPLQSLAELTFNSDGTVSGYVDYNDGFSTAPVSPDPVTAPSYTVDSTGRVTITGLTDASSSINLILQLYLDGNGSAVGVTLDTKENLGSTLGGQVSTSGVTDANFTGAYSAFAEGWEFSFGDPFSAVGSVTATGVSDTFAGATDVNFFGTTTTNEALSGSYAFDTAGILSPSSFTGLDIDSSFANTDTFNIYLIDTSGDGAFIETDLNQLTIGFFQQ